MAALVAVNISAVAQSNSFTLAKWTEVYNAIIKELNRSYVDSLEVGRIERAAVDAMLEALDPYTVYVPEEEQEDFQMMLNSAYGGIGAIIYKPDVNGNVIINEPYANSPAAKAGLRCGDEVEAIDGVSTHGLQSGEASEKMRGKPGTTVVLRVKKLRAGDSCAARRHAGAADQPGSSVRFGIPRPAVCLCRGRRIVHGACACRCGSTGNRCHHRVRACVGFERRSRSSCRYLRL